MIWYWLCDECCYNNSVFSKRSFLHMLLCETVSDAEWAVRQEGH